MQFNWIFIMGYFLKSTKILMTVLGMYDQTMWDREKPQVEKPFQCL